MAPFVGKYFLSGLLPSHSTMRALACLSAFGSCGFTLTFAEFPGVSRLMFCPLMSNNVMPVVTDSTKVERRGTGLGLERGRQPQKDFKS
jgi:hypothetical protein